MPALTAHHDAARVLNPMRDPDLMTLGAQTAGAISLAACRTISLSDDRVEWLLRTGRWQSPFPRTYVAFSGPIPIETRRFAALDYAGEGATLSHETAGALWKLCTEPLAVHVTVPYERDVQPQRGLRLHRSRTLNDLDSHPALRPRRTTVERTVADLLAGKGTADAALGLIGDAVRSRGTTPDRLRSALQSLPKARWRKVVLDALPDINAGAHSPLEVREAALRRRHGLPRGERQVRRLGDGAEYLDVVVEEFGVHVELDGRLGHDRARETWRDMRRDNRSEVAGIRHLRYGWADIVDRPCQVAAEQARILRQQGWTGTFRHCPNCPA